MSKSMPDTAKAFCPPGTSVDNPCLAYFRLIVFPFARRAGRELPVNGESYADYAQLETAYCAGAIDPRDLKAALAAEVNALLQPTRTHFDTNPAAAQLRQRVRAMTSEATVSA